MTAALQASSMKHHWEQRIAELWDIANGAAAPPQDQYEQIKEHYNWHLSDLYNHNRNSPTDDANHAHSVVDALTEHNDCLVDLESQ